MIFIAQFNDGTASIYVDYSKEHNPLEGNLRFRGTQPNRLGDFMERGSTQRNKPRLGVSGALFPFPCQDCATPPCRPQSKKVPTCCRSCDPTMACP